MPLMTDKYNAKEAKKNLHLLKKMYQKTLLDGNFQRWGGVDRGSGWSMKNGRSYITNFLMGATFNSIINVDAKAALEHCQHIRCTKSIEYFSKVVNSGYEYVSIDGNNSASYLTSFISCNEDIKIKMNSSNKLMSFGELCEDYQDELKYTEKINVVILRDITVDEMCNLFRFLNTQTKLNAQEWRQARISDMSQCIRDYGNNNREFFLHFLYNKEEDLDKRSHEELTAAMALKLSNNFSIRNAQKSTLDTFYDTVDRLDSAVIRRLDNIFSVCRSVTNILDVPLQRKLVKGQVMTFFDVIDIVSEDLGYNITDPEKFLNWFLTKNAEFVKASKNVIVSEQEQKDYTYWTKFYQHKNSWTKIRQLFTCAIIEDIVDLQTQGIVKYKRTKSDQFTFEDKLELMIKQNFETRSGDKIRALDVYLGKYEADHVKSVKDGGTTDLWNGEVMTRSENRQKGANSNQPAFDFQR